MLIKVLPDNNKKEEKNKSLSSVEDVKSFANTFNIPYKKDADNK